MSDAGDLGGGFSFGAPPPSTPPPGGAGFLRVGTTEPTAVSAVGTEVGPQGVYATLPITTKHGSTLEVEAQEGEKMHIPRGRIAEVVTADWGTDEQVLNVTELVRSRVSAGGLDIVATAELLGDPPAGEGQTRSLVVSFAEAHYVAPEDRLEGVDLDSPEGQRFALELDNDRLVSENVRLKELLEKSQGREIHFADVEKRLEREIQERVKLQQAVYENEGALVSVHVRELEEENARLRRQVQTERRSCIAEQSQRQRAEEELGALRDIRAGTPETLHSELGLLRKENDRLHEQVRELSRLNAALQRTLREQGDTERHQGRLPAADLRTGDALPGGGGGHVRVRRAALCANCRAHVEEAERRAASHAAAQGAVPLADPTPERSTHPRTTVWLSRSPGGASRPPHLAPPTPPPAVAHIGLRGSPATPPSGGRSPVLLAASASAPAAADSGWREFRTPEGRSIYHNVATAATQWQRPAALPP
eukprot:TRINITY_DN55880_c0_g1_i1.p1 TRINITY_DN55880_c0_g1~~TRINITY_DN55880_c0_g1_i1.p1  ORF type:complete len:479 (+),score=91.32 TRINITY_DN55880_c0_g1_i1:91-1527(+)